MDSENRVICEGCKQQIDPDTCWCGDPMDSHTMWANHSPIPMGCNCGREPEIEKDDGI